MDAHTAGLLQRAADDEAPLQWRELPEVPFGQHAQSAVEKLLKALIHAQGRHYPRTHDLDALAVELKRLGEVLPALPMALGDLTDYAMTLRYVLDAELPSTLYRQTCIAAVQVLRQHVLARVKNLESRSGFGP